MLGESLTLWVQVSGHFPTGPAMNMLIISNHAIKNAVKMKEMNAWNILECFGDRNAQPSVPCCCVLHGCKPTFDPQLEWSTLAEPEPNAALRAHRNCGNFMKHLKISMVQKYCVILRQLMIVHLYTSIQSVKYILLITGVAGAARLELIASLAPADSSAA